MIYIFDIDGTLADLSHRLHFIQQTPKDWDGFFKACSADKPIPEVIAIAKALAPNYSIKLITGRSDAVREETSLWLDQQGILFSDLMMRKAGDHREDSIVKSELLDELMRTYYYNHDYYNHAPAEIISGIFEDRQQVVDMYRARGLRVFQVAEGKF